MKKSNVSRLRKKAAITVLVWSFLTTTPIQFPFINPSYWNIFTAFFLVYQTISFATEAYLMVFPHLWHNLSPSAKRSFPTITQFGIAANTQTTSLIHGLTSGLGALAIQLYPSSVTRDHLFGSTYFSELHCLHSSAVFFSELVDILTSPLMKFAPYDNVILIHHTVGMIGLGMGSYGYSLT
jgi:hypothetical protein